jgi:hypothetical protein
MMATARFFYFFLCFNTMSVSFCQKDIKDSTASLFVDGPPTIHNYAYFIDGIMFFKAASENDNQICGAIINSKENHVGKNIQSINLLDDNLGVLHDEKSKQTIYVVDTCSNYKESFIISGLILSENQFLKLKLKTRHLLKNGSFYRYTYQKKDNCIEDHLLETKLRIFVKLNKKKLRKDETEEILKKIQPNQLLSVKRKFNLLGRSYISVRTS